MNTKNLDFIGFLPMELFLPKGCDGKWGASLYTGPVQRHKGQRRRMSRKDWRAQRARMTFVGEPLALGGTLSAAVTVSSSVRSRTWTRPKAHFRWIAACRKPKAPAKAGPLMRLGRSLSVDITVHDGPSKDRDLTILVPVWRARTGPKTLNAALTSAAGRLIAGDA